MVGCRYEANRSMGCLYKSRCGHENSNDGNEDQQGDDANGQEWRLVGLDRRADDRLGLFHWPAFPPNNKAREAGLVVIAQRWIASRRNHRRAVQGDGIHRSLADGAISQRRSNGVVASAGISLRWRFHAATIAAQGGERLLRGPARNHACCAWLFAALPASSLT